MGQWREILEKIFEMASFNWKNLIEELKDFKPRKKSSYFLFLDASKNLLSKSKRVNRIGNQPEV